MPGDSLQSSRGCASKLDWRFFRLVEQKRIGENTFGKTSIRVVLPVL